MLDKYSEPRFSFMAESPVEHFTTNFGSLELDKIVSKLSSCSEPRKRYEYLLFLAKKLPNIPLDTFNPSMKVKGCISQVYVKGNLKEGKIFWEGYSDALITKGMLSLLVKGLSNLSPEEIVKIDPAFITATGLNSSLTASRVNGFMNIFIKMKSQASKFL